jgi:hypothetical protein
MTSTDHQWWEQISFAFDPNARQAAAGEILVGLGNPLDTKQPGIVLNFKYPGSESRSVSSFVLGADPATLARWRECLPKGLASVGRVVLEDLSFDTCFALLMFAHLLTHGTVETPAGHAEGWRRYVTRWEEGYTREQRPWNESMSFLVTALGHSYLDLEETGGLPIIDPAQFSAGARTCLDLVAEAFAQGIHPESVDLGKLEHNPAFARARSHIEHERSQYHLALQHGKRCQLSVPLAGSGRRMIADALFLEEQNPSGLLKAFARSDRDNTWTRRGFDVLGLYRPLEAGTGGDMTISLAPESGLSLRTLWEELERLENEHWGVDRPRNHPRRIVSYQNLPESPNEPWWDDSGKYTLLGAPKSVLVAGHEEPGSKLDWYKDVLPALWKCYTPIPEDRIYVERRVSTGEKALWYCQWKPHEQASGASNSSVANCPTFYAWLKALSSPGKTIDSPMALPSEASYRVLPLDGGFLVIHRGGATAFDDWTNTPLDIAAISSIFRDMACAWEGLVKFHGNKFLDDALEYQKKLLAKPSSFRHKKFEEWKHETWTQRAEVLRAGVSVLSHTDPWPLNEFRALMSTMWGFDEQRRQTLEMVDRIDHVTSEIVDALRERRARYIQAVGAGLALGIVAKEVTETIRPIKVANAYEWQLELFRDLAPTDAVDHLEGIAHSLHFWELAALIVLIGGFVLGFILFLKFGTKPTEH